MVDSMDQSDEGKANEGKFTKDKGWKNLMMMKIMWIKNVGNGDGDDDEEGA